MHPILPRKIAGSQQDISDQLSVSILIDRTLLLNCGRAVLVILTADEAASLQHYLNKHRLKWRRKTEEGVE